MVGVGIGDGAGSAATDFMGRADGFARVLLVDRWTAERQARRMPQRRLEIVAYRTMAMQAVARGLRQWLQAKAAT